ncbi:hypothetical protein DTL42_01840 [Bremerella cremea]|uniref:Uncharacterized protein n=1 Tax=Bremerella cremea TaxID=1031537 RepID=A0A368KU34_9BACT|nr:hypothetical protein [Bremerella cremea]RCS53930.1 hypothetical protein DTL42_01840 [Bremerella cremea]
MPDKFDPYREALVVEEKTIWSDIPDELSDPQRTELARKLHADPAACGNLEYVRVYTGFCRQITVTPDDLARLNAGV